MARSCFINVGANTGNGGFRAPIYDDGSFVYAPIPESDVTVSSPTYRDLGIDPSVIPDGKIDTVVHFDPEFIEYELGTAYTYGDKGTKASRLFDELEEGDYIFFYATLEYDGDSPSSEWIHPNWGAYLIGHFRLATDPVRGDDYPNVSETVKKKLANNAHVHRSEFDADVLILGDQVESKLYDRAVPLNAPETQENDKYPQPNQLARHSLVSLDQTSNYGNSPWYRWLMVADAEGTDQLLAAVERFQKGDENLVKGLGAGSERSLVEAATGDQGEAFDQFMRNKDFTTSPHHIREIRGLFKEGWLPETEHALLGSFAYISGGWSNDVSVKLLEDLHITSLQEAKIGAEQGDLSILEDEGVYESHGHREVGKTGITTNAKKTPQAFRSFYDSVDIGGNSIRSFSQFIFELQAMRYSLIEEGRQKSEIRSELFETAREALTSVDSFGPLTCFDWLEVLVRAHGFEWLAPTELKPSYLKTGRGPERGFEQLFGTELDSEDAEDYLAILQHYGQQFPINDPDLVFTLESCLCQFQDLDEDDIDDLSGNEDGDSSPDTDHDC